jgi:hypothetical protein
MNENVKDIITRFEVCNKFMSEQPMEPLIPHPVPDRAWCYVSADLFQMKQDQILIVVDQYLITDL